MDEAVMAPLKEKMLKIVGIVKTDMSTIRSGRANPSLIENLLVVVYQGSQRLKIKQLATISTSSSRMLVVNPFDPATVDEIVKGIAEANIGLNPQTEGKIIRVSIPALTAERREEYLKLARTKAEGGKIMVRQARHEAMESAKKQTDDGSLDEDSKKRLEKLIQTITDEMIAEVEMILRLKEEDLSKI